MTSSLHRREGEGQRDARAPPGGVSQALCGPQSGATRGLADSFVVLIGLYACAAALCATGLTFSSAQHNLEFLLFDQPVM